MDDQASRHQLFETARERVGWNVQQLWVAYLGVGGIGDAFDIDAFLHGLAPLSAAQQDALATAVNEQLYDLYFAVQVPYLHTREYPPDPAPDLLTVLDDLLERQRRERGATAS